ncbi:TPA: hypothetical protein UMT99_000574 [Stenotrophomonas maltophilia]|nr:hypothetical protein [Stenotrophomonas maltophilia]HEL4247992.1 hypothetical protein [Stenotrophomonas maltophilia]HEL4251654.1 hypothetical protein [Stenotrophomonas maltophilia]
MDIYIDTNVLENFAQAGIDPVVAFAGSPYRLAVTPDLAEEYRTAITHEMVSTPAKLVAKRLLASSERRGIFGFAEAGSAYSGFGQGVLASDAMASTLKCCAIKEREGKIPDNRTDAFLAALSYGAVILTNDKGSHFKKVREGGGQVYSWIQVSGSHDSVDETLRSISRAVSAAAGSLSERDDE